MDKYEYCVVIAKSVAELEARVTERIRTGWLPIGGASTNCSAYSDGQFATVDYEYIQSMTKGRV